MIKQFLANVGFIIISLTLTTNVWAQAHISQAADGVYQYGPGHGFNSMFVVSNEGVVVFDPASNTHSEGLLKAIRKITDKPILYVVQSHNHWDHAGGGQIFRDQGATILAHQEAYNWMKNNPHPDLALPDELWAGKSKTLTVGDKTMELKYMGQSHGLGMTVTLLPKEKVAFIADLVTPERVMFTIVPDFHIKGWKQALREIEEMDFETAIFSHSHAKSPIGAKQDVILERQYIEDLEAAIIAEFQKGTSFEEIPHKIKLEKYSHWYGYNDWLSMNALRLMLDMWMGPY
ncbi:hypothetical protein TW78_19395 [Vibrio coralliilyticus]|uniref:Uncharacterized protein n=1 Tax=Vibrio coralliilyticus TaxID=190893 RepID=A0A837G6M8_9VIBR|nr:MBL fold metallo-hydrolase [Vibrio coralliilyticus]ARC94406.1 MBL fold metallo-hydrolase [Vibrio coralliilyticus]KJY69504.1 hypothetical protein TW78_19395 [Vibrio coralliilyticus]QOU32820.1 MBL fold metallo-hydrolase [Vibrio coralliilyticus]